MTDHITPKRQAVSPNQALSIGFYCKENGRNTDQRDCNCFFLFGEETFQEKDEMSSYVIWQ